MRQHSGQAFPLRLGPGPRFPLPGELESASSRGPSPATWGSPGVPYLPSPSGNPSTSCRLGLRAKSLALDSCPQRTRVLTFELRGCQRSLRMAEYCSRGGGGRIGVENGRKEGLESGRSWPRVPAALA